jgi:sensor histidine kinase YesM
MTRRKLLIEARDMVLLVAVGFLMTWLGLSCPNCREDSRYLWIMASFTSALWILLWKGNEYLGTFISMKISWIRLPVQRFLVGTAATILYSFLVMYLLTALYERTFRLEIGDGVLISVFITLGISLFMHGREFLLNWRKAAIQAEQYQQESFRAKYESLKNQVSPHFLFNSLNALSNLVYEDEDKAARFIHELSEVYRYVNETQDRETVPLQEEIGFLKSYLYLQQIRFGEKLRLNLLLDESNGHVPPLALQMLIENAIKHNIISEDDPLTITLRREENYIFVENNLQKKTSLGEDSAGLGLENIRRRYEMLGNESMTVEEGERIFRVRLPLLMNK